jgi:hypothetical protein
MANPFAIPGTGKRVHGRYFRRPQNVSIKRQILAAAGSLRGEKVPPFSGDDIPIRAKADRTWKRHRVTQWREERV